MRIVQVADWKSKQMFFLTSFQVDPERAQKENLRKLFIFYLLQIGSQLCDIFVQFGPKLVSRLLQKCSRGRRNLAGPSSSLESGLMKKWACLGGKRKPKWPLRVRFIPVRPLSLLQLDYDTREFTTQLQHQHQPWQHQRETD